MISFPPCIFVLWLRDARRRRLGRAGFSECVCGWEQLRNGQMPSDHLGLWSGRYSAVARRKE
eukprot:1311319-Rhodomonas_salina.1